MNKNIGLIGIPKILIPYFGRYYEDLLFIIVGVEKRKYIIKNNNLHYLIKKKDFKIINDLKGK